MTCHPSPVSLCLTVCVHLVRSKWLNRLVFIVALHLIVSRASISSGASTLNPPTRHKVFLSLALFYTSTHMEGSPSQTWKGSCSVKQMDHLTMEWKTKVKVHIWDPSKWPHTVGDTTETELIKGFTQWQILRGFFHVFLQGSIIYWPNHLSEVLCENAFKSFVVKFRQIHPYGIGKGAVHPHSHWGAVKGD